MSNFNFNFKPGDRITKGREVGGREVKRSILFLIVTVIVTLLTNAVAMACHPVIAGKASCVASDGSYSVEWHVEADTVRGWTWTVLGITQPDSEAFTLTTPTNTITVAAIWSSGDYSEISAEVPVPTTLCEVPTTTTTAVSPSLPATGEAGSLKIWGFGMVLVGSIMYLVARRKYPDEA